MKNKNLIYLNLILISASIVCFEIISTRISSVIFVNNYAYIILSLAILGLGMGGIYSHYKIKSIKNTGIPSIILKTVLLLGISLSFFLIIVILFKVTNTFLYFILLFFPFFLA